MPKRCDLVRYLACQLNRTGGGRVLRALRQAICRFPAGGAQLHACVSQCGLAGAERFLLKKIVKPLKFQKINISRMPSGAQYEFST